MNYVAIDWKTVNHSSDSACSMVAVRVENKQNVKLAYSLIMLII